ncbi:MAG: HD domain-containing protein, partial [Candidatus Methanomethylophilaceae archaeon]|nr:HD domain-containing protein [Candidatus Methanomethylophilaceae archaeon]
MTTKTVHDPIHGSIVLDGVFFDMMDRHEIQRLRSIRQLGLSNVVFPGANHTRFEHSLGVYHLAGRMAESLGLASEESDTIRAAAMLHDVYHPPFSHTLERL